MPARNSSLRHTVALVQQQLSERGLSFFHLTQISYSNQWQLFSFERGLKDIVEEIPDSQELQGLLNLLTRHEAKLVSSLHRNTSMARNAFLGEQLNADWNHTALLLAVLDRLCWALSNPITPALDNSTYALSQSQGIQDAEVPQLSRWKEEIQRLCRMLPTATSLGDADAQHTDAEINDSLLRIAVSSASGPRASLAARFSQAALGIRALEVRACYSHVRCVS